MELQIGIDFKVQASSYYSIGLQSAGIYTPITVSCLLNSELAGFQNWEINQCGGEREREREREREALNFLCQCVQLQEAIDP